MLPWKLETAHGDHWVRFHNLPDSKRYAEDESEHAVLLDRYSLVLDELFADDEVYMVTTDWADPSEPADRSAHRTASPSTRRAPLGPLGDIDDHSRDFPTRTGSSTPTAAPGARLPPTHCSALSRTTRCAASS